MRTSLSNELTRLLTHRGVNAVAESFFATLEHELLTDTDFACPREAHAAVATFIDAWYNAERRHSTLGYVSPVAYEQQLRRADRQGKAA